MKAAAAAILGADRAGSPYADAARPAADMLPAPTLTKSPYDFGTSIARLDAAVGKRPLKVFAVIDHGGGAATVGETLGPSRVLMICNPKSSTPFLQANAAFAQELPLRIAVFEEKGAVYIAAPDIARLASAYGITSEQAPITEVAELVADLLEETIG